MSDILAQIAETKRAEIAAAKRAVPIEKLEERAAAAPPPRGFLAAIRATLAQGRPALIAEIKKASPSRGLIRADFDPPALARAYQAGGATCLSVLTDTQYFQGRLADLAAARAAAALPAIRKDFMYDPYQVYEARAAGADAILIILAAVDDEVGALLEATAQRLGMDVLLEIHNDAELTRALARYASPLIGINNRDLHSFETSLAVSERLAPLVPAGRVIVGESGIFTPADLARLAKVGVRTYLVGESLMKQADVTAATAALLAREPAEAR